MNTNMNTLNYFDGSNLSSFVVVPSIYLTYPDQNRVVSDARAAAEKTPKLPPHEKAHPSPTQQQERKEEQFTPPPGDNVDEIIDRWIREIKDDLIKEVKRLYNVTYVVFTNTTNVDMRPVNGGLRAAIAIRNELDSNPKLAVLSAAALLWVYDTVVIDCDLAVNKWEGACARPGEPSEHTEVGQLSFNKSRLSESESDIKAVTMVTEHAFSRLFTQEERDEYARLAAPKGWPVLRAWANDCWGVFLEEMRPATAPTTEADVARAAYAEKLLKKYGLHPRPSTVA